MCGVFMCVCVGGDTYIRVGTPRGQKRVTGPWYWNYKKV